MCATYPKIGSHCHYDPRFRDGHSRVVFKKINSHMFTRLCLPIKEPLRSHRSAAGQSSWVRSSLVEFPSAKSRPL